MEHLRILLPQGIKPLNIAHSYGRISSIKQRKGRGLGRQGDEAEEYCAKHGLILVEAHEDSGRSGYTGANAQPGGALYKILEMIRDKEILPYSHLIVEHLDRMSRDRVLNAFETFSKILKGGIIIHTIGDGKIYTEESVNRGIGELILSISIMSSSHDESAKKVIRQRDTWTQKRLHAHEQPMTMRAPKWLSTAKVDGKIVFEPIPERAKIVKRIFEELAHGIGRDKIARRLNAEFMQAEKEGKDTKHLRNWGHGREWHGGSIQKITDTRAVIGEFRPGKIEKYKVTEGEFEIIKKRRVPGRDPIPDYFPRIIEDELFFRARQSADARKTKRIMNPGGRKGTVYSNLFGNGLTKCVVCKSPMNYRDRGPRSTIVFRCSGNRNGSCGNDFRYPYEPLEKAVLYWVKELELTDNTAPETSEI
jgi:DNA invertase Pin-like site-specific DNA recombinase